ncbi:MAG: glycoside hydrolase family 28 protein [Clostridiales bacterium]|nr:glycoside hydrolase family 28 protein [Clostridiales bacterium]
MMEPKFNGKQYIITDFGAKSEIGFDNQEYIQKAIDLCSKEGGGTVVIPQGYWLTSPIELKSNVCLNADAGAYVRFTKSKEKYPLHYTEYEGRRAIRTISPITALNAKNIAITGEGTFDGNGNAWRPKKDWKMPAWEWNKKKTSKYIAEVEDGLMWFPTESAYLGFKNNVDEKLPDALEKAADFYDWYRPVFISITSCENVLLRGVTVTNSPNWTIHPRYCKNVTVDGCYVKNSKEAQNSDGIDVDSCENVVIKNCVFDVGDDAICMKSGKGREARKLIAPTKNVEIYNCRVYRGHGGFVIGSEMSRGVENVYVHDCCFFTTDIGIRVKSALGRGGYIKNIKIDNITMCEIGGDCITFSMGYDIKSALDIADNITKYYDDDIPVIGGFEISNITCDSAARFLSIDGLESSPVKDIAFTNCHVTANGDIKMKNAENVTFNNVTVNGKAY